MEPIPRSGKARPLPSSVLLKAAVAATGVALAGWVALHALGLLAAFGERAALDRYAALIHGQPLLLWSLRAGLLACALVHVVATVLLARRARAARGARPAGTRPGARSLLSRAMRPGGALLLAFIVLHVLHMTAGSLHPAFAPGHVRANLVRGLSEPLAAAGYVLAAVLVALHVLHGAWSAPRSLGLREASARSLRRPLGAAFALALLLAFAALPIAVLTGALR